MKKTKILLVLAIAMLAMFAMSACGLVAAGIEKVEFEVMPKNYFSTTEIKDGIEIGFTATINGTEYPVDVEIEVDKTEYDLTVGGLPVKVKTNKALATTMGEHEIVVTAEGVMATYAYRVCEVVTNLDTLETAGDMVYYILGDNVTVANRIEVARSFVLYGEGYYVKNSGDDRVFSMDGSINSAVNNGFFEFNNVTIDSKGRGVNAWQISGATFNFNACALKAKTYAICFHRNSNNLTVNISNGTTAEAWNALYTRSNNSVFNIDNVKFYGFNNVDMIYSFATIVVDGDGLYEGNPEDSMYSEDWKVGTYGCNNVINISNSQISAESEDGYGTQGILNLNYAASKNVVNFENCTDKSGNVIETLTTDDAHICDFGGVAGKYAKDSTTGEYYWVRNAEGLVVYDSYFAEKALDKADFNTIYVNGVCLNMETLKTEQYMTAEEFYQAQRDGILTFDDDDLND